MSTDSTNTPSMQRPFTIKTVLVPLLTHPIVAGFIKYSVYTALVVNFAVYVYQDYLAYRAALPPDAPFSEILAQFATSIDMAAWLGLVFLFEMETYALPDEAFKGWLPKALRACRLLCYVSIAYAAYGYTAETLDYYEVTPLDGIDSVCELVEQPLSMQINAIEYKRITAQNCASLTSDSSFYRVTGEVSVLGKSTLNHVRRMGWVDVSNAFFWLLVVFLIEVEVWLQAADKFSSRVLTATRQIKTFFYLVLILNAVIWAVTGYYLYTWDAFLWIFGFWAIELNLAEWEQDRLRELRSQPAAGHLVAS